MKNSVSFELNSSNMVDVNQSLPISRTMDDINETTTKFNEVTEQLNEITSRFDKSLVSVYDNNPQQQDISSNITIGILGRNSRSSAFLTRLILSGFSRPLLCDINTIHNIDSNDYSGYINFESFFEFSPKIILITDYFNENFDVLFPKIKQQLIIDTREIISSNIQPTIPGAYRAFGNLSNDEIRNGSERIGVAVEQYSPLNLIKFIYDLKCFPRGILLYDYYSYQQQIKRPFENCCLPFLSTLFIIIFYTILSLIQINQKSFSTIFQQINSIIALTSITLLALTFFIQPLRIFIQWIYRIISKNERSNFQMKFLEQCFNSRRYFLWYSFSFALLHLFFILFLKFDLNSSMLIIAFLFGLLTIICLIILSFISCSWISERLLWQEYHIIIDYLGPISLLFALIHLYFYWYIQISLFNEKFLPLLLSFMVLILYGIVRIIQWKKT